MLKFWKLVAPIKVYHRPIILIVAGDLHKL